MTVKTPDTTDAGVRGYAGGVNRTFKYAGNRGLAIFRELSCVVDPSVAIGSRAVTDVIDFDPLMDDGRANVQARFSLSEGQGAAAAETALGTLRMPVQ